MQKKQRQRRDAEENKKPWKGVRQRRQGCRSRMATLPGPPDTFLKAFLRFLRFVSSGPSVFQDFWF